MNPIIKHIALLARELIGRYAVALSVGLVFLFLNSLIFSRFMSHFGMAGNMIDVELAGLMLIEVPAWMAVVKFVSIWHRSAWAEVVIAGIISIFFAQAITFGYFFWPNFMSEIVDSGTKSQMMFWFVFTVVNYLLATHTAAMYCLITWLIRNRRSEKWYLLKPSSEF